VASLRLAQIVACTEAEGPGRRFALWTQGCPLRCSGCCNPEMLPFEGGSPWEVDALLATVLGTPGLEGVTLLGGEPVAQASALAPLASRVRGAGLSVMLFSGHTLEELRALGPEVQSLLAETDLLVDGRYDRALPDSRRRWIGSRNQRLHFLTDRYRPDDPRFTAPNTLELRLRRGSLQVNGWPGLADRLARGGR
jgi:anaerobic ribonucleoside-triphosphate reductase activating protein